MSRRVINLRTEEFAASRSFARHRRFNATAQERIDQLDREIQAITIRNRKIEQLLAEIRSGRGQARSYEMAAKIANLAFLIEYMVHYNCKSGKDRTGLMDVESKFLAHQMHLAAKNGATQLVPSYALSTQKQRNIHQQLLWESGNLEMQAYNTGGQGFKIAPTAHKPIVGQVLSDRDLAERVGGLDVLKELQGLKGYTGKTYF